jgi:hypothetical protein
MTMTDDAARIASDTYWSMRQSVLKIAQAHGAEVRGKPAFPGAHSAIRYAEPLAGIRAAVTVRDSAERVISDYVTRAREDGDGWLEIGQALGLEDGERQPYDVAVAAYEQAAGRDGFGAPLPYWFGCGTCGKHVTDHGPYTAHPLDCEEGHAENGTRRAEAVRAHRAQWGDDDE